MADRVSIVAVSIAAFLTTINQISIIITAKQLWMQQQQLQQQLERNCKSNQNRHCRRKRDRRKSSTQREKILDFRRRTDFRADIDGRNSWEEKF